MSLEEFNSLGSNAAQDNKENAVLPTESEETKSKGNISLFYTNF